MHRSGVLTSRARDRSGRSSPPARTVWPGASQAAVQSAGEQEQVACQGQTAARSLGLGGKNWLERPPLPHSGHFSL